MQDQTTTAAESGRRYTKHEPRNWVWNLSGVKGTDLVVLLAISEHGWASVASYARLAEMAGVRRSALLDCLKRLEAAGLISRERRWENGHQTFTRITLAGAPWVRSTPCQGPVEQEHESGRPDTERSTGTETENGEDLEVVVRARDVDRDPARLTANDDLGAVDPAASAQDETGSDGKQDAPVVGSTADLDRETEVALAAIVADGFDEFWTRDEVFWWVVQYCDDRPYLAAHDAALVDALWRLRPAGEDAAPVAGGPDLSVAVEVGSAEPADRAG